MGKMKIFTINRGSKEGAEVKTFKIRGDIKIPAILIGESGRGRKLGVLPVQLTPENYNKWQRGEKVNIFAAEMGETKNGKFELIEADTSDASDTSVIAVLRTMIGFRGSNDHTGGKLSQWWELDEHFADMVKNSEFPIKKQYTTDEKRRYTRLLQQICIGFRKYEDFFYRKSSYQKFPGSIICEGKIAQGDTGKMGDGKQYIATIPQNIAFRTGYSGKLYGQSKEHYYIFKKGEIFVATWLDILT